MQHAIGDLWIAQRCVAERALYGYLNRRLLDSVDCANKIGFRVGCWL